MATPSSSMAPLTLLRSLVENPATREFLTKRIVPECLPYPITTLPLSRKLFCVPLSMPPIVCGLVVNDSPAGYGVCVIDDNRKIVVLVGECDDGTEVVIMHDDESILIRFEDKLFNKFINGGEVTPGSPGDCARRLPRICGEWCASSADQSTDGRIRKWATSSGKLACPVALLNGKVRTCRGLAVWELLSGNEVAEHRPQRRLARLAPAPLAGSCGVVKEVASEAEEKRRKAEERKARNRESAQRSNMRRKLKLQALKEELERVSLREKRLRKRERDLREENCELRMTVTPGSR